jgi:dipeptidase E
MKLLLTSGGLTNDTIANALVDLTGKEPANTKIAFIPTAANPQREDKGWLIQNLHDIHQLGYTVDIIDLLAFSKESLRTALSDADVIFVGGGNTFYLSYWVEKSGLAEMLPELLKDKVYAGISAGSMLAGQSLVLSSQALEHQGLFEDGAYDLIGPNGESSGATLGYANLIFRPHLNARFFSTDKIELLEAQVKGLEYPVYALDDSSALKIIDGNIEVVSEGEWKLIDPSQLTSEK